MENAKLIINRFDNNDVICTSNGLVGGNGAGAGYGTGPSGGSNYLKASISGDSTAAYFAGSDTNVATSSYWFVYTNSSGNLVAVSGANLTADGGVSGIDLGTNTNYMANNGSIDGWYNDATASITGTERSDLGISGTGITIFKSNQ